MYIICASVRIVAVVEPRSGQLAGSTRFQLLRRRCCPIAKLVPVPQLYYRTGCVSAFITDNSSHFIRLCFHLFCNSDFNPFSYRFNMESMMLNAPNAIGASTAIAIIYLLFHFLLKPKSHLDKLPSLGKPSDLYLQDFLVEGSRKVRASFKPNV